VATHIAKALDIDVLLAALASKLMLEGAPDESLVHRHLHGADRARSLADLPVRDERRGLDVPGGNRLDRSGRDHGRDRFDADRDRHLPGREEEWI
jgi:hypothetical protein